MTDTAPVLIAVLVIITLIFFGIMVYLTVKLLERNKGKSDRAWLFPTMITLLVLFVLLPGLNLLIFIAWLIILLSCWN